MKPDQSSSSDWEPLDAEMHDTQIAGLCKLASHLVDRSPRLLDLGCGSGRVLLPLVERGWECAGIDGDSAAVTACTAGLKANGLTAPVIQHDFVSGGNHWPERVLESAPYDIVCCLGNTFMLVVEPGDALGLVRRVREVLHADSGLFVIDDVPGELWGHVVRGDWCAGVNEDVSMQMVWSADDNVFALREGADVDENADVVVGAFAEGDRQNRLWTLGELRLLGLASGFKRVERNPEAGLILLAVE